MKIREKLLSMLHRLATMHIPACTAFRSFMWFTHKCQVIDITTVSISLRPSIHDAMRKVFPEYIVQCLIMSGFDSYDAISEMDIDAAHPGNSIGVIEDFIDKHKFQHCMSHVHQHNTSLPFRFPPGHKILIEKFVREMKKNKKREKREKRETTHDQKLAKKPKLDKRNTVEDNETLWKEETIEVTANNIRARIDKWTNGTLKKVIKENVHFTILVKRKTSDTKQIVASIRCYCGIEFALQRKNETWLLSNWTRHYKTKLCGREERGKQLGLQQYFTSASNGNTTNMEKQTFFKPKQVPPYFPYYLTPTDVNQFQLPSLQPAFQSSFPSSLESRYMPDHFFQQYSVAHQKGFNLSAASDESASTNNYQFNLNPSKSNCNGYNPNSININESDSDSDVEDTPHKTTWDSCISSNYNHINIDLSSSDASSITTEPSISHFDDEDPDHDNSITTEPSKSHFDDEDPDHDNSSDVKQNFKLF